MSSVREINTKYHEYYNPDDITNIKDLDLKVILVYERPYKKFNLLCWIQKNSCV